MHRLTLTKELELNREHIIRGTWRTRRLYIDGQEITLGMVKERLRRDGWYAPEELGEVRAFAWGGAATPHELRVIAYGCCEFAAPARWSRHITSRFALEQLFAAHLQKLLPADFALRYTDRELRAAMRCFKRGGKAPYWWSRLSIFLVHLGGEPAPCSSVRSHDHVVRRDGSRQDIAV
jgi:hypothetical protein